jgi:RNase adaptor protein for sRNA GlmZ degradation
MRYLGAAEALLLSRYDDGLTDHPLAVVSYPEFPL